MIQFHIVQRQIRRTIYHEDKCYLKFAKSYITLDIFVELKRQKITKFFIYIIKTKEIKGILGGREEEGNKHWCYPALRQSLFSFIYSFSKSGNSLIPELH